ncbi:MAG: ral transcriptional corepressor [Blastocatellia bacterium]|nr:ral transcriptional corepressor [Blastocatellia bacterium]
MLLAGVFVSGAQEATAPQNGKEVVEAAQPKTPKKRGAKSKPAKAPAPKTSGKQLAPAAAAQTETTASVVNPKDAAAYYDIGLGHYESKRFREAVEALKQSIRLGSTDPKTFFTLGQSYYSLGLYREAREAYKRVVRLKPDWAEAHYQLGWMYHILDDKDAAQEQYKILQTLSPETAANFQKLLDDDVETAAAANAALNNRGLTNGAASNSATTNQETAKASVSDADAAAAPVKIQEAASTTETATPTTAAPAGVVKQTPSSEATGSANANSAAAHNVTDSNSSGASPANTNLSLASASPAPASANPASPTVKDETTTATTEAAVVSSSELPLTSVYRIGVGDVLDIRLLNSSTSRSTLFTVMNGGLIEYPLVGGSFAVTGLTTDEIGARLAAELKRRSINVDSPVVVSVRDYTSHTAIVSGLVNYPGKRILRREATPLYVIIAEAQLRPDASRAVIVRGGAEPIQIDDLTNPLALNVLVKSDDFITISARQLQYYFIGGRINSPGQKAHQPGLTLIQAILAAGGLSRSQDTVEISREETSGRLTTTKYVLKDIKAGKIADPRIQPGDRIEVGH